MSRRFCVSYSGSDHVDRAAVCFAMANAALESGKETIVLLNSEGVRLSVRGYSDDMSRKGFAPVPELMRAFVHGGGTLLVHAPCFKKRHLNQEEMVPGAKIADSKQLMELLGDSCPSLSQ